MGKSFSLQGSDLGLVELGADLGVLLWTGLFVILEKDLGFLRRWDFEEDEAFELDDDSRNPRQHFGASVEILELFEE